MVERAPNPTTSLGRPSDAAPGSTTRAAAQSNAGLLLVLTAIATVVAVVGRVGADTDLPTLAASLAAIAESRGLYGTGGAGRLASGVTLIAAAWWLHRAGGVSSASRRALPVVVLFAVSGLLTAYSGAAAVVLAAIAPDGLAAAAPAGDAARQLAATAALRQISGAVGFALAGAALVVAGWRQWAAGSELRGKAAVTALLGLAMQLIWLDAATLLHRITGIVFVVWLVVAGGILRAGRWRLSP
ncbi:MAG: hypothetical protein OXH69_04825 [Acidobacteria bacterium]|nr:hypothetical protein [Acidobacteriota bacterium]